MQKEPKNHQDTLQNLLHIIEESNDKERFVREIFSLYKLAEKEAFRFKENNEFIEAIKTYRSVFDIINKIGNHLSFKDLILQISAQITNLTHLYLKQSQFEKQLLEATRLLALNKYADAIAILHQAMAFYNNIQLITQKNFFAVDVNIQKILIGLGDAYYIASSHSQTLDFRESFINQAISFYNSALGNHNLSPQNINLELITFYEQRINAAIEAKNTFVHNPLEENFYIPKTSPQSDKTDHESSKEELFDESISALPEQDQASTISENTQDKVETLTSLFESTDISTNHKKTEEPTKLKPLDGATFAKELFKILQSFKQEIEEEQIPDGKHRIQTNQEKTNNIILTNKKKPIGNKKKKKATSKKEILDPTLEELATDYYNKGLELFEKKEFTEALANFENAQKLKNEDSKLNLQIETKLQETYLELAKFYYSQSTILLERKDYKKASHSIMEADKFTKNINQDNPNKDSIAHSIQQGATAILLAKGNIEYSKEVKNWLTEQKREIIAKNLETGEKFAQSGLTPNLLKVLEETKLLAPLLEIENKKLLSLCIKSLANKAHIQNANELYQLALFYSKNFPKQHEQLNNHYQAKQHSLPGIGNSDLDINQPALFACYAMTLIIEKLPYIENILIKHTDYKPFYQNLLLKHSAIFSLNTIMQRNSIGKIFKGSIENLEDKIFYSSLGNAVKYAYQDFKNADYLKKGVPPINTIGDFISECTMPVVVETATSSLNIVGIGFNPFVTVGFVAISSIASGVNCYQMHMNNKKHSVVSTIVVDSLSILSTASTVSGLAAFFMKAQIDTNMKIMTLMKAASYIPETYIIFDNLFSAISQAFSNTNYQEESVTEINGVIAEPSLHI